jgi:phosphatidylcholine synthase
MAHVEERLPRFSGERLDLVVDYVTYVFVPALALLRAGYLTGTCGLIIAALILLSSLYHFSDLASKGEDYSFIGFPAIWNVVALYVFVLSPPAWLTYTVLIALVVLTFVPMPWVHPMRVKRLQAVTLAVTAAWAVAAIAAVWHGFPAPLWTQIVLVAAALYLSGLTVERVLQGRWED